MNRHKKWVTAGVALSIVGILAGCGNANNTTSGTTPTSTTNQTVTNSATNTTTGTTANTTTNSVTNMPTGTNTTAPTTAFQAVSVTVQPGTTVTFRVPQGWNKQNVGAGDTGGSKWINPKNSNQWVRILYSGNVGALQNKSGNYDVKSYINTPGITWTSVSSNNLSGNFTVPVGAINNKSVGYGYAQVLTKPNPLGVTVEVVAPQSVAQSIVQNVSVNTM